MENATKALLISGGILIALLVISMGVYLFSNYSSTGSVYEKNMETTEIQKFNSNFIKFEERKNITIQEIITLANFAKQYEEQTEIHVKVIITGEGDLTEKVDVITLIQEYSDKKFTCENNGNKDIIYDNHGRVNSISFR